MTDFDAELLAVAATARELAARSRARRVMVVLDRGDDAPALLDWSIGEPMALSVGEADPRALPEDLGDVAPLGLPEIEPLPVLQVDATAGEITGPMGAVARAAAAVRDAAAALPGRSVLTVLFQTSDPDAPLAIAARSGEPVILALGDEQFPMPDGWPGPVAGR
jgi:hypothetical protein